MSYFLYIKNMVNLESLVMIDQLFKSAGLHPVELSVGKVSLKNMPTKELLIRLNQLLSPYGYSIIEDNAEKIAVRVKTALEELLTNKELMLKTNLSVYLSNKIHYEYHYLSTVFSDFEKKSIAKYFIQLKIDKAKELIIAGNLSFGEIAYRLGYSSQAHFTNQFKQVESKSPTAFKLQLSNKK